jgi:predicted amidohydrolase YtcJ
LTPPDLIIVNARIATGNPRRPWATALAIRDNALAAMGQAAEIQKMAHPTTQVINAHGAELTLPPGATIGTPVRVVVSPGSIQLTHPASASYE